MSDNLATARPEDRAALPERRAAATPALPNGIAAGDPTPTSAVLWARSLPTGPVTVDYGTDPSLANAQQVVVAADDPLVPAKLTLSGLTPGTDYFYRVTAPNGEALTGRFETPALPGDRRGLRFGVSSCSRGELSPYPAIANADERELDFFVRHGDTIYADYPSPFVPSPQAQTLQEFRVKHQEPLSSRFGINPMADLRASTATIAITDDHELADDYSGGAPASSDPVGRFGTSDTRISELPIYRDAMQAFAEYNPIAVGTYSNTGDPRFDGKPDFYYTTNYGSDAVVIRPDTRSFRDQKLPPPDLTDEASVRAYLARSFDIDPLTGQPAEPRTLLGQTQLDRLKQDLLAAQANGTTWKLVMLSMSMQNLGIQGNSQDPDRYEGFARERAEILEFIEQNAIENVVWVVGDVHSTIVNNVSYQRFPGGPQILTDTFEVTTGSIAFDPPAVPFALESAINAGILSPEQAAFFNSLPTLEAKDTFAKAVFDSTVTPLGYDTVGLAGARASGNRANNTGIDATLLQGNYLVGNSFGWTEFEIDATTQQMIATTYGIDPYQEADLAADPAAIAAREPRILGQFTVNAKSTLTDPGDRPTLAGDALNNVLNGSALDNTLEGATGNDLLLGGGGADRLDGGDGSDTASYYNDGAAVAADLAAGTATDGTGAIDTLAGVENLTGSAFDDTLTGDGGDNELRGGAGADTLTGGGGSDAFAYKTPNARGDVITDFGPDDRLQFQASGFVGGLGAGLPLADGEPGQNGTFVAGESPTPIAPVPHFLYDTASGTVAYDPDGTGTAAGAIPIVTLAGAPALTAAQFEILS